MTTGEASLLSLEVTTLLDPLVMTALIPPEEGTKTFVLLEGSSSSAVRDRDAAEDLLVTTALTPPEEGTNTFVLLEGSSSSRVRDEEAGEVVLAGLSESAWDGEVAMDSVREIECLVAIGEVFVDVDFGLTSLMFVCGTKSFVVRLVPSDAVEVVASAPPSSSAD